MFDYLIRNGRVVDGTGLPWIAADVGITGDCIAAVGALGGASAKQTIDATGMVVCPGFVDAHVHGDLPLLADPVHEQGVRQGVTTHVIGQDGVAFAPASPATMAYMRRYTAGFNGNLPTPGHDWHSIGEFLAQFDGQSSINACVLIPNGNVRMEVLGLDPRKPTARELSWMKALVREGMEQGAVGLSSGLDYVPSIYADEDELTALCEEIAPFGGMYVTHMRGYNREKAPAALQEVFNIGKRARCGVHVSHFNCLADQTVPLLDAARAEGVDVTFDLYCYLYGSTIVAMLTLPPETLEGGIEATVERLKLPETRKKLEAAFANPRFPIETIRLASLPHDKYRHLEGHTLPRAAELCGQSVLDFTCDLLIATDLAAGCVIRHFAERQESDILKLMKHPLMMAGSDGIYVGGKPHPRGTGCFARYLGHHVRNGDWTLEEAVMKCSYHVARRFGLKDRGLIREGLAADVVVFDAGTIADRSTYDDGKALAVGVEHVFVNGTPVLLNGERTNARPGRGLKRG
ncbi:N-acyl-D-glutamate deacylase [Gemmata sp. SH-PL17]|uniref:N-acyl-D-amino-acid deacylase family protein n=1 Tax=Gemmata sp. SH-PL17 TaxID=1630693 RepID=UPI00078B670C|nr:D-aminoacylase [Gemmata sp. SH-PL17]AMV23883.1 N-acyl-D-glutamate deacylase [Gemmata sp. SH-PL17]